MNNLFNTKEWLSLIKVEETFKNKWEKIPVIENGWTPDMIAVEVMYRKGMADAIIMIWNERQRIIKTIKEKENDN